MQRWYMPCLEVCINDKFLMLWKSTISYSGSWGKRLLKSNRVSFSPPLQTHSQDCYTKSILHFWMLLYSYNFSVTFQRKCSSYYMRALKKKWYLNIFLDALFFVLKESIRANDMSRKKWKANKKKKKAETKIWRTAKAT